MPEKLPTTSTLPSCIDDQAISRVIGWATATHLRAVALLVLIAATCFLPGLAGIAPVDRDEARFVQATRQMLETGDFVDIRLQDEPRYKKPIGIYWLQAAAATVTGQGASAPIWAYRLVSVLGGFAAVLLTYWAALPLFGRRVGFIAAAAMATSLLLTVEAHLAKTDAVLLATVVLAQGVLARAYVAPQGERLSLPVAMLFWFGLGLGILVKGPIVVMVVALTATSLAIADRRIGWLSGLRPALGVPLALLIVLPWFLAILSISGTGFFSASIGGDLLDKLATGQESHWGPPGYHLVLAFILFLPMAVLLPSAIVPAWRLRRQAAVRFCLAWLLPTWLVFELVATKLPHYTLPLYPALAILVAVVVDRSRLVTGLWWTRLAAFPAALMLAAAMIAGVVLLDLHEGIVSVPALVLAFAAICLAFGAARAGWHDQLQAAGALLAGGAIVAATGLFGIILPEATAFQLSPRIAATVARVSPCPAPDLVSTGYDEPSLVFATDTGIRLADPRSAADFLGGPGCRLALVEARKEHAFLQRAGRRAIAVEKVETVAGMSLGRFEPLGVGIYRAVSQSEAQ